MTELTTRSVSTLRALLRPGLRSNTTAWRIAVYAVVTLFSIGWTIALGADIHWDALNYHLYLGFSALHERFAQDFFAAGPPSYINPYAYVPLYLGIAGGMPALVLASGLALVHAVGLYLVYEITLAGARSASGRAHAFALLAVVLAGTNPILLQALGTTFADPSVSVLVIGGWTALARGLRSGSQRWVVAAALLCGVGAALKLSNAIFALAAIAVFPFWPGSWARRLRAAVVFVVCCALAFFIVALPWAWQLWREFRNPFFPFLNHLFHSPDFTSEPLRYERFIPVSLAELLWRPFAMLKASGYVHTEPRAPDLRYVVLLAALLVYATARWLPRSTAALGTPGTNQRDAASDRVLFGLLAGLALAWCLWLGASGNSRYFLPMACVASAVVALLVQRLHARWPDATVVAVVVALLIQFAQIVLGSDWKREGRPWNGSWLAVQVPERLRTEPYLYVALGFQSGSALAPFLHRASGLINISGFQVLAPGHPGGARTQALLDRNRDRLRMLAPVPRHDIDEQRLIARTEALSIVVSRFGFVIDVRDCEFIRIDGALRGAIDAPGEPPAPTAAPPQIRFLTCRLRPAPTVAKRFADAVREIDVVFDRVEDACPNLFRPRRAPTELRAHWVRTYNMGSEVHLWMAGDRIKYFRPIPGGDPIDIGSVAQWKAGALPFDCSRKEAPAFGGILK